MRIIVVEQPVAPRRSSCLPADLPGRTCFCLFCFRGGRYTRSGFLKIDFYFLAGQHVAITELKEFAVWGVLVKN